MPVVDPSTVSLLSWLGDEEWCAFNPEIKRRYAREAKAVRGTNLCSASFPITTTRQLELTRLVCCFAREQKRDGERLQREAARAAREVEQLRREEAGEESLGEDDDEDEDEDEDVCQSLQSSNTVLLRFVSV